MLQSMGWQRVRHDCATEQQPKTKHNVFRDYFTCYFSSMYMDNETTFQFSSVAHSCPTPWTVARQSSLSITNSRSLLKLMSVELVMSPNRLILCHPLLLLPSLFPQIRVFSNESVLHIRWPKYWSFSFSISPSNEYLGLLSFRTDWFDLLVVQRTLKSLLQHHSSKTSILWHSDFFMVQLTSIHDYWKNHSFD